MAEPRVKALRDHIVAMHELASAFLIADRMLLIDKVTIVALGAVDGHRLSPREDRVIHIFSEGEDPVGQQT